MRVVARHFEITPQGCNCHSRESGNPYRVLSCEAEWIPAFAGMTPKDDQVPPI